ncbi:uncharacterized protein [Watersipora subatra]|uniref:uncharacterized protein n=1 Tax=Watersipora subatra TaxID=2589382 RepID=UPI00355C79A9
MWLNKGNLTANTESLVVAAQEQVLPTRQLQTKIYHTRNDPGCRLCKDTPETIQHIISGRKQLVGSTYTEPHNHVAGVMYRSLCDEHGLNKPQHEWKAPGKVNENDHAKILWDFYVQIDKHVLANQLDIVVVDKESKRATIIDITVPNDYNIASKKREKIEKYLPLGKEIEKRWDRRAMVFPVVIEWWSITGARVTLENIADAKETDDRTKPSPNSINDITFGNTSG